jgi:REP-associated tyrosine transposase
MPRLPRVMSAGFPQHVIQRGNNREPCFFTDSDYLAYLRWLERAACAYRVSIHAYVLMPNHVHLLATPGLEGGLSRMMQYLGRHYVQHVNRTYGRSGTLWERRFRASLIEGECCLLAYRYIEANPVRAGMVAAPEQYCWSSAKDHVAPCGKSFVVDHDVYIGLGDTPRARAEAYLECSRKPLNDEMLAEIRLAARRGVPLGSDGFKDQVERELGLRVRLRKPGRKPKR